LIQVNLKMITYKAIFLSVKKNELKYKIFLIKIYLKINNNNKKILLSNYKILK